MSLTGLPRRVRRSILLLRVSMALSVVEVPCQRRQTILVTLTFSPNASMKHCTDASPTRWMSCSSSSLRAVLARTPAQLLPFAHAFDDRFFVLDLAEPSAGDFPVLVASRHRGDDLGDGFPSSAAWLASQRIKP